MKEQMKQMHEKRGEELASQMTVPELISQLMHKAEGIPRLGIRPYNWWNEALHGVARAGTATVFPQAICMAASFSEQLLFHIAEIISDEARAKYNESQAKQEYGEYRGLTMWSPNINMVCLVRRLFGGYREIMKHISKPPPVPSILPFIADRRQKGMNLTPLFPKKI